MLTSRIIVNVWGHDAIQSGTSRGCSWRPIKWEPLLVAAGAGLGSAGTMQALVAMEARVGMSMPASRIHKYPLSHESHWNREVLVAMETVAMVSMVTSESTGAVDTTVGSRISQVSSIDVSAENITSGRMFFNTSTKSFFRSTTGMVSRAAIWVASGTIGTIASA